jgi:hypothetical protein
MSRDVCLFGLSGFVGAAISLTIILLIQSQTFSLERPAPFGSIEFLRFRPDVGLLLYIFASIIIFVSGYFGDRHAFGLPPPPPSTE